LRLARTCPTATDSLRRSSGWSLQAPIGRAPTPPASSTPDTGTSRPDTEEGSRADTSLGGAWAGERLLIASARDGPCVASRWSRRSARGLAGKAGAERLSLSWAAARGAGDTAKSRPRSRSPDRGVSGSGRGSMPRGGDVCASAAFRPVALPSESFPNSVKRGQNTASKGTPSVIISIPIDRHLMVLEPSMAKSDSFRSNREGETPPCCWPPFMPIIGIFPGRQEPGPSARRVAW
jgi:hypothetical protein